MKAIRKSTAGARRGTRRRDRAGGWHPYLGAHMSIAGGLHHSLEDAARHRAGAVQLFSKQSSQWRAKPLDDESVRIFRETNRKLGPFEMAVHDSYLINLASPDRKLRDRSVAAFIEEIERCERLGIPRLVFHPGAHMGAGEAAGLRTIGRSLRACLRATSGYRTRLLLENTAGQGTTLGYRLEQIAELLDRAADPDRMKVCLDTCHLLAAGYDFRDRPGYERFRDELDRTVGIGNVDWFHLNDSRRELGSRVDRHAHIGKGHVGTAGFRFFLTDPAFRVVPMVLEAPKIDDGDRKNLALLRRLSRVGP